MQELMEQDKGLGPVDTQKVDALMDAGLRRVETHVGTACSEEGGGLVKADIPRPFASPLSTTLATIKEVARVRDDFVRTKVSITLRIKALQRENLSAELLAATTINYEAVLAPLKDPISKQESSLKRLTKTLPIWEEFAKDIRGFGIISLANILAETGDLSNYTNPAKVWKRMSLHVVDGKAARLRKGAEALKQNFVPRRRALMHVIGECLIKGNKDGPYKTLYDTRKALEIEKNPDLPLIHNHKRAMRVMEKRLLRDLWRAWRDLEMPRS